MNRVEVQDSKLCLSLQEALNLNSTTTNQLYAKHINPSLMQIYGILGFSDLDIVRAEGVELELRNGRTLLDFSSSFGILSLGHNHPRVIAAEQSCHQHKVADAIKLGPHKLQAALAYNISQLLPEPLEVSFFCTSGAEANEAALKLCLKAQGQRRTKVITCSDAFHGKTLGTLPLTSSEHYTFGLSREQVLTIKYGDLQDLSKVLRENAGEVAALIIEPIQGQGVIVPPPGYLKALVKECRKHKVLVNFDEVKVGLGRAGSMFAFEQEGVVPDIVTFAKALGGGKREIEVMTTSAALFNKAYGSRKTCALHTTTFSGLGESCAVAIEVLNTLMDENMVEQVKEKERYFKQRLLDLQTKYPNKIAQVRGRGLMLAIDLNLTPAAFSSIIDIEKYESLKTLYGALMGAIIRELYQEHGIMAYFSPSHPTAIQVMPPLIVEKDQIDRFVNALAAIFAAGFLACVGKFVTGNVVDLYSARSNSKTEISIPASPVE